MPLPKPTDGEKEKDFMGRCMSALKDEFPEQGQRVAVCMRQFRGGDKKSKDMAYDLDGVELFRPGTWNGGEYTEDDIDAIVDAFPKVGFVPPVKLGHEEKSGAPAYGWVRDLRKVNGRLVAKLSDLPESLYNAIKDRRYNALSSEIFLNLKRNGESFRRALKAVALLGAEIPAVSGLKPLSESLSQDDSFDSLQFFDIEAINMDELNKLKEEVARLSEENKTLQARKDLTDDVAKLKQAIDDKEAAITASAHKIAKLQAELDATRIEDKVSRFAIPALRDDIRKLYQIVDLTKVAKFGEEEVTAEAILDDFVKKLNAKAGSLFSETGVGGGAPKPDESPSEKLARLSEEYALKHKVDYREAQHAVLDADKELAAAYAAH